MAKGKASVADVQALLARLTDSIYEMQGAPKTALTMEFGDIPEDSILVKDNEYTENTIANTYIDIVRAYTMQGYITKVQIAYSDTAKKIYVKASKNGASISHNPLGSGVGGYAVDFTTFDGDTMKADIITCANFMYDKDGYFYKLCL